MHIGLLAFGFWLLAFGFWLLAFKNSFENEIKFQKKKKLIDTIFNNKKNN